MLLFNYIQLAFFFSFFLSAALFTKHTNRDVLCETVGFGLLSGIIIHQSTSTHYSCLFIISVCFTF